MTKIASMARGAVVCCVAAQLGDIVEWEEKLWIVAGISESELRLSVGVDLDGEKDETIVDACRRALFLLEVGNSVAVPRGQVILRMRSQKMGLVVVDEEYPWTEEPVHLW